jgi:hypothetical protein
MALGSTLAERENLGPSLETEFEAEFEIAAVAVDVGPPGQGNGEASEEENGVVEEFAGDVVTAMAPAPFRQIARLGTSGIEGCFAGVVPEPGPELEQELGQLAMVVVSQAAELVQGHSFR